MPWRLRAAAMVRRAAAHGKMRHDVVDHMNSAGQYCIVKAVQAALLHCTVAFTVGLKIKYKDHLQIISFHEKNIWAEHRQRLMWWHLITSRSKKLHFVQWTCKFHEKPDATDYVSSGCLLNVFPSRCCCCIALTRWSFLFITPRGNRRFNCRISLSNCLTYCLRHFVLFENEDKDTFYVAFWRAARCR